MKPGVKWALVKINEKTLLTSAVFGAHLIPCRIHRPKNVKMKNQILKQHGIETRIESGRLFALDVWTKNGEVDSQWVDATAWTIKETYNWLGY